MSTCDGATRRAIADYSSPGGIRRMVAVITRTCAGPIHPAANSAAVPGSAGGNGSPVSDRRA